MRVYFDNAATTRALPQVAEAVSHCMQENYGNPASVSVMGMEAEKEIIQARKLIAGMLGAKAEEIYFTSGGTESDNWAVFGTAEGYQRQGKHIITTAIEHSAILAPCEKLQKMGYEVTVLPVDPAGRVSTDTLSKALRHDTILVSIMAVNNELGTIEDIEALGRCIHMNAPKALFHVDGVQAFGKLPLSVTKAHIHLLSISGHKIHGPKGIGALYRRTGVKVAPLLYGGGQQGEQRPGTENAPLIAGFAVAVKEAKEHMDENLEKVQRVKSTLVELTGKKIADAQINGEGLYGGSPYVLSIAFPNVRSEVLLHALEEKGIFVSAGSACNSRKKSASHVLQAIGLKEPYLSGTIRLSFSRFNTMEEVEYTANALAEIVPILQRQVHR